jgi:tetratricopeptide (TPR) repeat protein
MSDDINREILLELRKLKRVFYLVLVFVILGSVPAFYVGFTRGSSKPNSWDQVTTAMRRQDFSKALSMGQALVSSQPNYYYGHAYLGAIYLAMGDVTNAEAHYLRAYELFPNEESGKDLAAARNRKAAGGGFKLLTK